MSRYFFSGGIMPCEHLLYYFNEDLKVEKSWTVSGNHYKKTCYAWLDKMDSNKNEILQIFEKCYNEGEEKKTSKQDEKKIKPKFTNPEKKNLNKK